MKWFSLGLIVLGLLALGCRGTRQIQSAINKVDSLNVVAVKRPEIDSAALKDSILRKVFGNNIDFNYFLGKVKIDFSDSKGKNTNANAFIRIKKDSLMWISLTGALGIEGLRIMVTKDSVMVMDKLEKTISVRKVSYLQDIIRLPVDFQVLQDLIIGNPVFFPRNIISYKKTEGSLMALSIGKYFKHMITLDTASNRVLHSKLDDVDELRNRTCDITLDNYQRVQNRLFSHFRELTVTEKSKLDVLLEFKQISFDEPVTFPFNVPKNYLVK